MPDLSKAQQETLRAHLTQRVIELLVGDYAPPGGAAEVVEVAQVGNRLHVELEWKGIFDLSKENI